MTRTNYPDLIKELAFTDFKLRYHNSVLGYLWSLLNPLLLFGVLYMVFSVFLRFEVDNYPVYLLFGIVIWSFFSESTLGAMNSLINKASLIKKIYFPRSILIISSNLTTSFGFLLNFLVFLVFFFGAGLRPSLNFLFIIPYFIVLLMIIVGVSLLISSIFIRFRDLSHIWGVLLQLGFWITPIVYPLGFVPEKYHFWILLNPIARIIFDVRNAIMYSIVPSPESIIGVFLFSLIILFIGYFTFRKLSPRFAEWL
ncbi:MAG: ABC transporter permease [Nanoarchaeota archaeon]|nr:ABC transporter permease [Nanoarchaeota archaeon]